MFHLHKINRTNYPKLLGMYSTSLNLWTYLAVNRGKKFYTQSVGIEKSNENNIPVEATKNKLTEIYSELTEKQYGSATIRLGQEHGVSQGNDGKVRDVKDLFSFTDNLFKRGEKGLCQIKEDGPYQSYREGYPSVPSPMIFWFRGHNYPQRDLVPSVHRFVEEPGNSFDLENALVNGFLLNHPEYKDYRSHGMCEILAIMQHYGYPTRFLDWSSSIMSAAYFACSEDKRHDSDDGIIWILNPFKLNIEATVSKKVIGLALKDSFDAEIRSLQAITDSFNELKEYALQILHSKQRPEIFTYEDFYQFLENCMKEETLKRKMRYSIALDLGSLIPRISAQKGMFTIAAGKQYYDRSKMLRSLKNENEIYESPLSLFEQVQKMRENQPDGGDSFLKCILIKSSCKKKIRDQLDNILGINKSSMMLDLDSHGHTARNLYHFNRKR